jgi:glc operon protein GlcG
MRLPMKHLLSCLFAAAGLALGALPLHAQVVTKTTLGLELAKKIAARAEAEATAKKWTVVVALVDDGGNLVYLSRMDGTQLGSIEVAQAKAKTALKFKRPTKAFEDAVAGGRNAILSLPDALLVEGGVPLVVNGATIGAIGISGMKSAEDGEIAAAALAVLNQP